MIHYLEDYFIPEPNSGCWLWDAGVDKDGYGKIQVTGKSWRAHRYMYFLEHGSLPDDLMVCHTCDVPACINPVHLFLGTGKDNLQDMAKKGKYRNNPDMREFCLNGHVRTEENIYLYRGKRLCRVCRAQNDADRYERDGDKRRQAAMDNYWLRKG